MDGFLVDTDGSMVKLESISQLRAGGAPHDMDPNNFLTGTEPQNTHRGRLIKEKNIPARGPKQCVVRILKGKGPKITSGCKLAGQERP